SNNSSPSLQSPKPEPTFMWPLAPTSTNSLPHASAKSLARSKCTHSSFVLATTIVLNDTGSSGIGLKPDVSNVDLYFSVSQSLGATSKAPFILVAYCRAQRTTAVQPRLWATSTTFSGPAVCTSDSIFSIQWAHAGLSHSVCTIL